MKFIKMLLKISDCNNSIAMQTLSRVMAISCTTADTYICRILVLTTKTRQLWDDVDRTCQYMF